jgi:AraC-like DNA-binding protein
LKLCDSTGCHDAHVAADRGAARNARGILHARTGLETFTMARHPVSVELAPFVEYLWSVEWDRRGLPPHEQRLLPTPAMHLSVQPGLARVVGPRRTAWRTLLTGRGRVIGVRFRPGGARPWSPVPLSELVDGEFPVTLLADLDADGLQAGVREAADVAAAAALVDAALVPHRPPPDATVERVSALVAAVDAEPGIRRVEQLAERAGTSVRGLQRLCAEWIGIGPKELVRWARLHEAAGRVAAGPVDWAALAAELGYADQAHLVRDFSRVVGEPPARYARAQQPG